MQFQKFNKLCDRQRTRDNVSLPLFYSACDERGNLLSSLYAFRVDVHSQLAGKLYEHSHDGICRWISANGINEEFINLEDVRAQPLNLGQAVVTNTNVVNSHLESILTHLRNQ